ncbi:transglutaminase domain-containing protein [Methanobacterium sp.]|uniref:transglutaminase domain-containing protein n=1 Tax=Methanobacterium sp. TaxID=2164 RepID=UPI003C7070E9
MGIGGGTITRKLLFAVLLIFGLSLVGIAGASAADVGTTKVQSDNYHNVQKDNKTDVKDIKDTNYSTKKQNNSVKKLITNKKVNNEKQLKTPNKNITTKKTVTKPEKPMVSENQRFSNLQIKNLQAAAGETKTIKASSKAKKPVTTGKSTVTSKNFTVTQINSAAARVNTYIKTKHKLPKYVTIGTSQVKMPAFLKLLTADILQLNSGKTTPIKLKNVKSPSKTTESFKSGKINKSSYLELAKRVNTFINEKGVLPKQTTSALGKMNYKSLIYTFSKIPAFYKTHKRLPGYVSVKHWSTSGTTDTSTVKIPASLKKYVKATKNCQVNNARIKSLAKQITRGKKTRLGKAVAIFNWVRDKIGYKFYYNTRKGAVGTLNARKGNCVDTAHLLIALERAAGIPARYVHGKAKFRSGKWYGHVWAGIHVNGKWYKADATSSRNSFGVIKNWTRATIKGKYASLPF